MTPRIWHRKKAGSGLAEKTPMASSRACFQGQLTTLCFLPPQEEPRLHSLLCPAGPRTAIPAGKLWAARNRRAHQWRWKQKGHLSSRRTISLEAGAVSPLKQDLHKATKAPDSLHLSVGFTQTLGFVLRLFLVRWQNDCLSSSEFCLHRVTPKGRWKTALPCLSFYLGGRPFSKCPCWMAFRSLTSDLCPC